MVVPFASDAGLTEEQAMGICANFGGGLKRALACGAITGGEKKPHCDALVFECVELVEKILVEQGKIQGE